MAQTINVNTTPGQFMPTLYYSQGDIGREFEIVLASSDGWSIPAGATVTMVATKPSGFGFSVAGTLTDNVASFTTTETMTNEHGRFPAEIRITSGTDVIGTANFYLSGEKDPHPAETIDGDASEIIPELTLLVERVETAASSVLDMTVNASTLSAGSQATYSYDEETNTATFGIPQGEAGAGAAGVTASAYSSSRTYAVGDYVIHNSNLYRCTTAITTAEAFTAAHWTQVVLADDVSDVKSDLKHIVSDEYDSTILSVLQTVDDWALKEDGFAESNSSYRLIKYNIKAGDVVLVEGAERYQFQASPSVPSSGTSPKIGDSHAELIAVAPNGANYLIVSKKKSASSTASVIVSKAENIETNTKGINGVRSNVSHVVTSDMLDIIDGVKWYQGTISGGALIDSDYRITTDYIVVTDFLNYTKVLNFALANGWSVTVNEYDIVDGDYSRIKYSDWIKEVYALDEDTKAIRIVLRKDDESQIGISASSNVKAYIPTYNSENEINVINNNVGFLVDAFYKKILLSTVGYTNGYRLNEADGRAHTDTNYNLEKYSVEEGEIIHVANADRYQFQPVPSVTVSGESTLIGSVQNVEKTIEVPSGAKYLIVSVIASEMPIVTKYDDSESLSHYAKVLENETIKVERDFVPFTVGTPNNTRPSGQRYNRANLMFFTDSHIDMSNPQQSRANVKHAIEFVNNSPIQFDAVMNAGDAITPFYITSKSSAKALAKIFFDMVKQSKAPVIYAKGNHDLNDWENYPSNAFDDADWGEIFYDYAESEYGIVRQTKENDEKSTWHYLDLADHKIRIISVDVQDTDKETTTDGGTVKYHGGVAWYISQEQMDWLISTALNFDDKDEKDWGVICVLHQDISYSTLLSPAYESAIEKFKDVCVAFNTQSTYSDSYTFATDAFYNLSINADFTRYASEAKKPHMICWLMGHEHVDLYEKVNGINMIWTANSSAFPAESDQRLVRAVGTNTQNCFDIMSVDTVHRKIRMFRFGAGVNCFGVGGNRWTPDGLSY